MTVIAVQLYLLVMLINVGLSFNPCCCCHSAAAADGWGFSQMQSSNSLKMSVIGGIHAVHYFRGARGYAQPVYCAAAAAAAIGGINTVHFFTLARTCTTYM